MSASKIIFVAFCTFCTLLLFKNIIYSGEISANSEIVEQDIKNVNEIGLVYPSVNNLETLTQKDKDLNAHSDKTPVLAKAVDKIPSIGIASPNEVIQTIKKKITSKVEQTNKQLSAMSQRS